MMEGGKEENVKHVRWGVRRHPEIRKPPASTESGRGGFRLAARRSEGAGDAVEGLGEAGAHRGHGRDDGDRDERRDETVLDGRRAGLVREQLDDEVTHDPMTPLGEDGQILRGSC